MGNDCNEKGHYQRSPVCPVQKRMKEEADKYRASQPKSESTTTEAKQAFMNGIDSDDFSNPQAMFCQTSQVVGQIEQNANASPHRSAFDHNKKRTESHFNWPANVMSQGKGAINEDWCLLDNQSTCNVFTNRRYL